MSAALFRSCLEEALLALHGAVGGAVGLELLRFDDGSGEGLVAVDGRDAHKLWPAAALVTQMRGEQCTLQVRIPDRSAVTAPASGAVKRRSTGAERCSPLSARRCWGARRRCWRWPTTAAPSARRWWPKRRAQPQQHR